MDQAIRNKLRSVVTQCRRLLEESIAQQLQGRYDIYATGKKDEVRAEKDVPVGHLTDEERQARQDILAHFEHITVLGYKPSEALEQLIREIAFTHLNRLCAYKMMEVRDVYVGGQRFREAVSKGLKSQGFLFYLADHPEDERRFNAGDQEGAYRHFLNWLGGTLSQEIGVLFSPTDPANRVCPPQRVLDDVLDLINSEELKGIWSEDETIGWVYQYFTPKELRDQARKESQAPRNSYELAFRNQFFTPRYVVEFLTDNTLGRIWYEVRRGNTQLKDQCRYMVRRPGEVFFSEKDGEPGSPVRAMRDLLLGGTEATFPPFRVGETQRLVELAHTVDGYERHPFEDQVEGEWWPWAKLRHIQEAGELSRFPAQDLLDVLFCQARADRHSGGYDDWEEVFYEIANEIRRRAIEGRNEDASQQQLLRAITAVAQRVKKDPREIKILDPACGSGHFLLYGFALLLIVYEEAYDDPDLGLGLHADYPTKDDLRSAIPSLILRHNLHGIDIDLRCTQIAALALWLRCQRAYQDMGLKKHRPPILKANVVCAEPMPGEEGLLDEFLKTLREDRLEALIRQVMNVPADQRVRATRGMVESLSDLIRTVWDKMRLAGEAGSLLKVEDELQDAIRQGQEQWEERLPLFRFTEYGLSEEPKERLVRFVPGDVEGKRVTFWDKAETLVRRALDEFVTFASNGGRLQRQLFVEDAEQGLGFVDVCRRRYDVVLMNPPFGDPSRPSKPYIDKMYKQTKNDLYAAFVERGLQLLKSRGLLGAITSRSGLFLTSFERWRKTVLLKESRPTVLADLGYGVLDSAMVETAAYCLERDLRIGTTTFIRLVSSQDKESGLSFGVQAVYDRQSSQRAVLPVDPDSFRKVPGCPFAYWTTDSVRRLFENLAACEGEGRALRQGGVNGDDFRYLRLFWEVPVPSALDWRCFQKGGDYSPYYSDIHLVVNWDSSLNTFRGFQGLPHRPSLTPANCQHFFKRGVTWSRRSQRGLSVRLLPDNCGFSDKGPTLFGNTEQLWRLLAIMNSLAFRGLVALQMAFGSYEVGVLQRTVVPDLSGSIGERLGELAKEAVEVKRTIDTNNEISHQFVVPGVLFALESELRGSVAVCQQRYDHHQVHLQELGRQIDDLSFAAYGLDPAGRASLSESLEIAEIRDDCDGSTVREEEDAEDEIMSEESLVAPLISYGIGLVFGRWDVRNTTRSGRMLDRPDPFAPLPECPPGMLRGPDGLPAVEPPEGYPLCIDWDGILVDDPDRPDDIIRRVRDALEVIWMDRSDAIEKEACEILGVADLRDYFRKPGAGGFWDDHIKRYTKSRRKAPIYWLLQSSKKNYALWIYYHRLDKDILFKALLNYVEPKIRKEEARLGELRSQKAALGPAAKGGKKLDKDIDRQEAFLSELRDFEDKLRRAANLHLDPDLDDGVVLNIAPLHELVPWKEAKSYWDDLMDGKYEWSSIGKQLREKGLVK